MKVSVITINYNNLEGLLKTKDSILAQTSHDYEWIVVDGGSSDGSAELLEESNSDIAWWISEPDRGVYDAMRKGIVHISGDYCIFMNSGDCFHDQNVIADFINFVGSNGDFDIIYGNTRIVRPDGSEAGIKIAPERLSLSFFYGNNLNHQSIFYNKRCFEICNYGDSYRLAEDRAHLLRLLVRGCSFAKIDRFIARYDNEGMSSNKMELCVEEADACFRDIVPPVCLQDVIDASEFQRRQQVDLYRSMERIVNSNRLIRNLARIIVLPLSKLAGKSSGRPCK